MTTTYYPNWCCCSSSSSACCSCDLAPATLYVTFSASGGCACMDGVTVAVTYDPVFGDWEATYTFSCNTGGTNIKLICVDCVWGLDLIPSPPKGHGCSGQSGTSVSPTMCSPLQIDFPAFDVHNCCEGTITAQVTE